MSPLPLPDPLAALAADDPVLAFTPVPGKARRDGWSAERQRQFVLALRESGSVADAARAAGCTKQSAYRLRKRDGGAGFARAWEQALDEARLRQLHQTIERAMTGRLSPCFYRGRFVRLTVDGDDAALIASLARTMKPKGYK